MTDVWELITIVINPYTSSGIHMSSILFKLDKSELV